MSDKDIKRRQSYDEPMGVPDVVVVSKFPEAMNPFHVDHGSYVLAVEVERLREVESDVLGDNECFRKRNAELEAELQRFREREPLVQAAIETAIEYAEIKGWERLEQESKAVRDFKLK